MASSALAYPPSMCVNHLINIYGVQMSIMFTLQFQSFGFGLNPYTLVAMEAHDLEIHIHKCPGWSQLCKTTNNSSQGHLHLQHTHHHLASLHITQQFKLLDSNMLQPGSQHHQLTYTIFASSIQEIKIISEAFQANTILSAHPKISVTSTHQFTKHSKLFTQRKLGIPFQLLTRPPQQSTYVTSRMFPPFTDTWN